MNNLENKIQLNKFLSQAGLCSRRKAELLIKSGQITVNNNVIKESYFRVLNTDIIKYKNKPVTIENKIYILLNKPKNYITTVKDEKDRKTVLDLIKPEIQERVFPVGRLDRGSTGLLLLTNDGHLSQKLSHPSNNIKKTYIVVIDRNLNQKDFNKIVMGIYLSDGFIKPDSIQYLGSKNVLQITIHSGKNRIIRRIFESLFYKITKLERIAYSFNNYVLYLNKKELPQGAWRFLSEKEITLLKS